ncbi:MAG: hypothetical protein HC837_04640 [Chloroflexaceae bacterium]|nr:hypothetical protein [Chloroflexaceae bacterium]
MIELRAPVQKDAYERELGVAVDQVALWQTQPQPLTGPWSLLLVMAAIVLLVWQGRPLLQPLVLASSWLLVLLLYQPQFLPDWLLAALLVLSLLALWQWLPFPAQETVPRLWGLPMRPLLWLLATFIALWLVLSHQMLGHWVIDDAFISFRYAYNLVRGDGLVFNPGEAVEGYTNFLWTVLIAGAMALGGDPVTVAAVLTMLLAVAIVILTARLAAELVGPLWAWLAPLPLLISGPFLLYTTRGSGMETALFTMLVLASLLALVHNFWMLAGWLVALTTMTRPDGILLVVVGGLYALAHMPRASLLQPYRLLHPRHSAAMRYSLTFFALYLPYFLWRWSYYGYLLPNTFYAKVGGTQEQFARGLGYLWESSVNDLLLPLALLGLLLGCWAWLGICPGTRWPIVVLLASSIGLVSFYIVGVGGDWMPEARFLVPVFPLMPILAVWALAGLMQHSARWLPLTAGVGIVLVLLLLPRLPETTSHTTSPIWTQNYAVRRQREVGRWMREHTPPDALMATAVAGAIPYYADRPTLDILGLTDEHIAHLPEINLDTGRAGHEKTDLDYALQQRPELIPYRGSDLFWGHPVFQANYQLKNFPGPEGHGVRMYVRKDVLSWFGQQP